jgi:hypothetical protein
MMEKTPYSPPPGFLIFVVALICVLILLVGLLAWLAPILWPDYPAD